MGEQGRKVSGNRLPWGGRTTGTTTCTLIFRKIGNIREKYGNIGKDLELIVKERGQKTLNFGVAFHFSIHVD